MPVLFNCGRTSKTLSHIVSYELCKHRARAAMVFRDIMHLKGKKMYSYVSRVAVIFEGNVFEATSIQIGISGAILVIDRSAVKSIAQANGGKEAGADVIVKFHQTRERKCMLEGHLYEGKVLTSYWSGEEKCHLRIDFVELSPLQVYQLETCLLEITGSNALAS